MVLMDNIKLVILFKLIALKDFYTPRLEAQYKLSLVMFNATSHRWVMYQCSTKTREVLGNLSPTLERFP